MEVRGQRYERLTMRFGEVIRRARLGRVLTLEKVAKACGTHKGYISGIEGGKVNPPSRKMVQRLCLFLGLDYRQMLTLAWAEKAPRDIRERLLRAFESGSL